MKLSTVAKVIARQSPEAYRSAVKMCEPCITNPSVIPAIHKAIKETYPELDRTDESILFAATVYTAYSPACLLASGVDRAPNGIRKVMCEVMGWQDAPVCNYYADLGRAYIKGAKFKERVSSILLGFQQFSVRSNQIELF
ncbi:hypothetical protein [Mucilaginibacter sp. SP1R1]|uniref:hypothetical protein n=1 Tax=Mucilaginibacter sp. SP1R1 TaxID=2723091 RepID=UPI001614EED7|nr:hypothetical protein [Mucilaginibacter sp. SP1R1]MBB6149458.1 hypothetical protein [Mucilaginibacter sp. SP1R1]